MLGKGVSKVNVRYESLYKYITNIFEAAGLEKEDAKLVAEVLSKADLRGISSHGISRIPIYIKRLELGLVNKNAQLTVLKETASTAALDGGYGLGQVVASKAMKIAIDKARKTGVGIVTLNKSHHFGIAAHYAEMAAREGMIGMVFSNSTALMAPPGGASKAIGNNPFSFAFPAGDHYPVIFDMACSAVAQGKIIVANINGDKIPDGWALDAEGKPTNEPAKALKGFLLPAAGVKGYGLAVVVEALAGVLSGAQLGSDIPSIYGDLENKQNCGHFFAAIKIDCFMELLEFEKRMDYLIDQLKNGKKAPGYDEIFMPGEIELRRQIKALQDGINIDDSNFMLLQEVGDKYGVKFE